MSPAFDDFEQQLVKAGRELSAERQLTTAPASGPPAARRSFRQRLSALSHPTKLGAALAAVCTLGGAAFAATQLHPGPGAVNLQEQLTNLTTPMGASCSYETADVAAIRRILDTDGLRRWRIMVSGHREIRPDYWINGAAYTHGCHSSYAQVLPARHEIWLSQQPVDVDRPQKGIIWRNTQAAYLSFRKLDERISHRLVARCESVSQVERLWKAAARAAGFRLAGRSLWRYFRRQQLRAIALARQQGHPDNELPDLHLARSSFYTYTLKLQPMSQHTGQCAHVFGEGQEEAPFSVYIARVAP